jgi:hypothetical protein
MLTMRLVLCFMATAVLVSGFGVSSAVASRAPKATERAALAQAMKVPQRCLKMRVATVRSGWASATLKVPLPRSCQRYAADGIVVWHKRGDVWRMQFAGSSWKCPIKGLPEAVRKDLKLGCPEG